MYVLMAIQIIVYSAGMARCYRQNDLNEEGYVEYKEFNGGKAVDRCKIYPVCLHPKYGGWFGIRALVIFPGKFAKIAQFTMVTYCILEFTLESTSEAVVLQPSTT